MATTQLFPIYTKLSRAFQGRPASRNDRGEIEIVAGMSRVWLALRCPTHAWSWPRANKDERTSGFDSHQTCYKCMSKRMFDTQGWQAGPVYKGQKRTA